MISPKKRPVAVRASTEFISTNGFDHAASLSLAWRRRSIIDSGIVSLSSLSAQPQDHLLMIATGSPRADGRKQYFAGAAGISEEGDGGEGLGIVSITKSNTFITTNINQVELQQEVENLRRENKLITSAWYDMTMRLQSNTVVLQRRSEAPKSWLGKQRVAVGGSSSLVRPTSFHH
jgi:protein HOOK3